MSENITQKDLEECNLKIREMFQKAEIETLQKNADVDALQLSWE